MEHSLTPLLECLANWPLDGHYISKLCPSDFSRLLKPLYLFKQGHLVDSAG